MCIRDRFTTAPALALRAVLGERAQMVLGGQRALPARLTELGFVFRHATLKDALAEATSARGPVELRSGAEPS